MTTPESGLRRDLQFIDAVGIGLGAIVGAGIFVLIGPAAEIAGASMLVGLLLAGIAALANALSSAQLAARYPRAGGAYEYGYELLSPWAGFIAGWMFLVSKIAAAGTVAIGLAGYLAVLVPEAPARSIAVGAIAAFTALNYLGVKRSSQMNLAMVALSIGALSVFILAGARHVDLERLQPFAPAGIRGVLESAALLFFAYTGYARIATLAEEVHEPGPTIPRAVSSTLGVVVLVYVLTALVALGSAGAPALAASTAPLHDAALEASGPGVGLVVVVGAISSMLGVILSQLLGLSRTTLAMARRGDLPSWLAYITPRYAVPGRAVVAIGVASALVAAAGTLHRAAASASFAILVYYGIANLAALRLPAHARRYPAVIPAIGLFGCVLLALSLSVPVVVSGLGILAVGVVGRLVSRRRD